MTQQVTTITPRLALVAPTTTALRDTMVEGVAGILATSPPGKRPEWEPSKKKITWPIGCFGKGFSAEEPVRLSGPESSASTWADEPAHWPLVTDCWANIHFRATAPEDGEEPEPEDRRHLHPEAGGLAGRS